MSKDFIIQSQRGSYTVRFCNAALRKLAAESSEKRHFIIDSNIVNIYREDLESILLNSSVLIIEASESAKTLDHFTDYVETLVSQSIRRDHLIIAIGGGIIQDITAFLATTMLRGIRWEFYPTTLLAQADSCIGSKSSINVGSLKNILGTYCPPEKIIIDTSLLETLGEVDIRSGIGEMLKVHAIAGPDYYNEIAAAYKQLQKDRNVLQHFIIQSLKIKKTIIEADEFDKGLRNVMNYGHSFGHAIESASNFLIPHGIAVTIGMDIANYIAFKFGYVARDHFDRMHPTLMINSDGFHDVEIPQDIFLTALSKDKKNVGTQLSLILPDAFGIPQRIIVDNSIEFQNNCTSYFSEVLIHG